MFNIQLEGIFIIGLLIIGAAISALGALLKLVGVLLLSWWWIAAPVPAALVFALVVLGVLALLD